MATSAPCLTTMVAIASRPAPRATRMPISRVLSETAYERTPYTPTTDSTNATSANVEKASRANRLRATESDNPVYVYEPETGQIRDGVAGTGPVILAVDHLPCELPVDSSVYFSRSLKPFISRLDRADFKASFADCGLPPELAGATIVYHGKLTEPFKYLEAFLER